MAMDRSDPREILNQLFDAALSRVSAEHCMRGIVEALMEAYVDGRSPADLADPGRIVVLGAGKASGAMAAELEAQWGEFLRSSHPLVEHPPELSGLVVVPYHHGSSTELIDIVEASHPVPDEAGRDAARRMLDMANGLGENDCAVCLLSGGGSALLALPAPGIDFEDKRSINSALLRSGANITEMNIVRKHISAIKGGRLAAACHPARVCALVISDVPGDDPATVASGPTVADASSVADAREILARYRIDVPRAVDAWLSGDAAETPFPGAPALAGSSVRVLTNAQGALESAAQLATSLGINALILGDAIEGEARDVGMVHAGIAKQIRRHAQPCPAPCVILSGGETTVTVDGNGRGGRNAEFALGLAIGLSGLDNVYALAADTDGIDGIQDNAGCFVDPQTPERATELGMSMQAYLADNDAYTFFERLGDLLVTGPTRTNVNDFRAMLVL
jgi:hydroxypyruvate reductase